MHDLVNINRIKDLKKLGIYHLSTRYDEKTDTLIFDRELIKGNGGTLYGLLVAKYIVKDDDFMRLANEIKNELLGESGEIVSTKPTRYNPNVFLTECAVCNKKNTDKKNHGFLDCHHITSQKLCKANGYAIAGQKVHDDSNLIVLCKNCHYAAHHNKLKINGYVETSRGRMVDFQVL
jgi:DNA mismatch repair protein MutS